MSVVEIEEAALAPAGETLLAAALDTPTAGLQSPYYGFDLRGWAIGASSPVAAVTVRLAAGQLGEAETGGARPDVAELYPEPGWAGTSGFFLPLGALRLDRNFELALEARLEDGSETLVASIRGHRAALETGFVPAFGRSP